MLARKSVRVLALQTSHCQREKSQGFLKFSTVWIVSKKAKINEEQSEKDTELFLFCAKTMHASFEGRSFSSVVNLWSSRKL